MRQPIMKIMALLHSPRLLAAVSGLLFAFLWFIRIPELLIIHGYDVDSSWMIGLQVATLHKWIFGRDILFTFGPLHFLFRPLIIHDGFWRMAALFHLLVHTVLVGLFWWLLRRNQWGWLMTSAVFACLWIALNIMSTAVEYKLLLIGFGLYLSDVRDLAPSWRQYLLLGAIGFLCALAALIKFNALILSTGMLLVWSTELGIRRTGRSAIVLVVTFIATFLTFWLLCGQPLTVLPTFIKTGLHVAAGYSQAMHLDGPHKHYWIAFLAFLFLAIVGVHGILSRNVHLTAATCVALGLSFFLYKHGFTRHDFHAVLFFAPMITLLLLLVLALRQELSTIHAWLAVGVSGMMAAALLNMAFFIVYPNLHVYQDRFFGMLNLMAHPGQLAALRNAANDAIRTHFQLSPETVQLVSSGTVDVVPHDICLAYAYDWQLRPQPTLQSYGAYTAALDQKNAAHFSGSKRPAHVLYSYSAIDGRYPIFDAPAVFKTLVTQYQVVRADHDFLLLALSNTHPAKEAIVQQTTLQMNTPLSAPEQTGSWVWLSMDIRPTLFGRLVSFFFKPPIMMVTLSLANGEQKQFRFIPTTARNGLFLSQFINDSSSLLEFFQGHFDPTRCIRTISLGIQNPHFYTSWFYHKPIQVTWTASPLPPTPAPIIDQP